MENLLSDLMQWIQAHPHWAGLFVLIVSALESLLVVGLFVPGTVVMFGIGAMIAAGSMELVPTLIWATIGAILGDGSSYFIGRIYHQRLRVMWPFRSHPRLISSGVDFFHRHGGKSLVLARFVGPVRPLVPAVAGMLDMPVRRFFLINILSAMLWAPAYILPGVLFGASLGVAAEIAGRLALLLALLVALLWFSWWLMRRISRTLQPHAEAIQLRVLDWSQRHSHIQPLAAALLDPAHPEARGMTLLTILLVLASWAAFTIPGHVGSGSLMYNIDQYLFHWLQTLRSPLGDQLLIITTQIGDGAVLYGFTATLSLMLLLRRRWRAALHWVLAVGVVSLLTQALKLHTAVPRPPLPGNELMNYAFPSAHASVSVAVFGFLAVVLARELRSNWHWVPYSIGVFLVVAIGFSRLYLGVHWLSDVLAGWSLGLAWVALMGIAYRHHPARPVVVGLLAPVALFTLLGIASFNSMHKLDSDLARYRPLPATPMTLATDQWLSGGWQTLSVYRDDLKGLHTQPLDIQWAGELPDIETLLLQQGWRKPRLVDLHSLLDLFNSDSGINELPVLPQVHKGESQQVLLVRDAGADGRMLTLRLWPTGYSLSSPQTPLWVGNVSWLYVDTGFLLLRYLRTDPDFSGALDIFLANSGNIDIRQVQRQAHELSHSGVSWGGRLLLIRHPVNNLLSFWRRPE